MDKPLCLLVGEPGFRTEILTEALQPWVTVINQSVRGCIEAALHTKPDIAVFTCSATAGSHAHEFNKQLPNLPVVVEKSAEHGLASQNGFSALISADASPVKLVEQVKALCPFKPDRVTFRRPEPNRTYIDHLPAIAASLNNCQRLSDQAITAFRQASGAHRALLFYNDAPELSYRLLSSSPPVAGYNNLDLKRVASCLFTAGTALHVSDTGLNVVITRFMEGTGTNLLIPFLGESGVEGWIAILLLSRPDSIDFHFLQTLVHFTAESIRSIRSREVEQSRYVNITTAFEQAFSATLLVGSDGQFKRVNDFDNVLVLGGAKCVGELKSRRLRRAIMNCVEGSREIDVWNIESHVISVLRLNSGEVMVFVQSFREKPKDKLSPLSITVWEYLSSWASDRGNELSCGQQTLAEVLNRLRLPTNIRINLSDRDKRLVLGECEGLAVATFTRGLLQSGGTSPMVISCRRSLRQLHLDFVCEFPISLPTSENAQDVAFGIILLGAAGINVEREIASLGTRWTLSTDLCRLEVSGYRQ